MAKCTQCGGSLVKATTKERREVAGQTFTAEIPAQECKACGETLVEASALEAYELAIARTLATEGADSGEAFKFMRKALGLRAADLAQLLGVAAETLSRWECDQRPVDRGALVVLGSLVLDRCEGRTTTIDRLHALGSHPKLAKSVAVDIHVQPRAKTA